MRGTTHNYGDLPGLANATVEFHINLADYENDGDTYFAKRKISDIRLFAVRDEARDTYGGPLLPGTNEIVGDSFVLHFGHDHGTAEWDMEVVAKLPNGGILFAFEGRIAYTY